MELRRATEPNASDKSDELNKLNSNPQAQYTWRPYNPGLVSSRIEAYKEGSKAGSKTLNTIKTGRISIVETI